MTEDEFRSVLIEERDRLLEEMRREGFFCRPYEKRFDATTWDINNGLCDDFFCRVLQRVPEITEPTRDPDYEDMTHVVIEWQGRFYDAECTEGVLSLDQLPMLLNRGRSRDEVIASRSEGSVRTNPRR